MNCNVAYSYCAIICVNILIDCKNVVMTEFNEKIQEKVNLDEAIDTLSHEDLCEITQSSIKRLIASDPLLSDLPVDVTPEEVLAQIAVIQGQNITVTIIRYSESPLNVVIPQQNTTVLDLKKAIKRSFILKQLRQKSKTKISWKYIWKTFWLQNTQNGKVLKNDKELVTIYGVANRTELRFVKRLSKSKENSNSLETC
ncbi:hypothetical protein GWI33_022661 [Rhynchophorus ferrugineus]|uniref:SNRNP25 ubiquitin-like domain-containing protein n=1 Tax=Rhynchophorus ferrugineus TaxID=354439 RepID=A0A834IN89_RHYFE|nr:hypothetical protein GWI33_022661 [Rhynchophorus ferrugineus]